MIVDGHEETLEILLQNVAYGRMSTSYDVAIPVNWCHQQGSSGAYRAWPPGVMSTDAH